VALRRKVERVLTESFPPPAKVRVEDHDGIYGSVVSNRFKRMEMVERQNLIGETLAGRLNQDELRHIQFIVGFTPEEAAAQTGAG